MDFGHGRLYLALLKRTCLKHPDNHLELQQLLHVQSRLRFSTAYSIRGLLSAVLQRESYIFHASRPLDVNERSLG
jgi:hypothetical protein